MTKITMTNDFHGTSVTIRAGIGQYLSPSQIRRSRSALCGSKTCTCGGPLGERGRQSVIVDVSGPHSIKLLEL